MRKRWGRPAAAAAAAGWLVSCSVREKGRIGVPVRDGRGDRGRHLRPSEGGRYFLERVIAADREGYSGPDCEKSGIGYAVR